MNQNGAIALCVLALVFAIPGHTAEPETKTLCFFSLNNVREFELTYAFLEEADTPGTVRTIEFHDPGRDSNPKSSFRSMLESPQTCDGLVISGHHTGSFGGNRASGVLNINFLEELSCDPRYEDFFQQVQAVWLQGCRTLGVGPIEAGSDGEEELQADYHMQRVGAELIQDGLEQSFSDLSIEFSATLDQDNPLPTRYQRVFPAATLFGWTRSSPGVKARSEKSLLYHMSHMAHVSLGAPLANPLKRLPPNYRSMMSASMWKTLSGDDQYGAVARQAWLSHGRTRLSGLGFDNPDLNAYPALLQSSQSDLMEARTLACELRTSSNIDALQVAFTRILSNPDYLAYNLNALWDAFWQVREQSPEAYEALKQQMASSAPLMSLLNSKLKSPQTGLLMKIEYYSFYRELTGDTSGEVEALIIQHVRHFMLAQDLAGSAYDIRDFRESLLISVASHQLADTGFYRGLIQDPQVASDTLSALSWSFVKQSPPEAEALIQDIIIHPQSDSVTLRGAALWVITHESNSTAEILAEILAHPGVDDKTLETVSAALIKYELEENPALVEAIVAHPKTNPIALGRATLAMRKHGAGSNPDLVMDILSHPAVEEQGLQNLARAIGSNREMANPDILLSIIEHQRVDADALSSVAIALGNSGFTPESPLYDSVMNHPRADERTLRYVDRAKASNRVASTDAPE